MLPIVSAAKYLGSMMNRDSTDDTDVDVRNKAASRAFGALSKCVFKSRITSLPAKREAYMALVLPNLLYGRSWLVPYDEAMEKTADIPPLMHQL